MRILAIAALLGSTTLLVAGCATDYSWSASVPLSGPVGTTCLLAALDAEHDVFDVVQTGDERIAFALSLPERDREDWPSFSLHRTRDLDERPVLSLSTHYREGLFEPGSNAQLLRARDLIATVAEACTGRRPQLGEPHPCGHGEPENLCVDGS